MPAPRMHPLASVYIFERANDDGLVALAHERYPLIPRVFPPMKRAVDVHHALLRNPNEVYAFAIARSYIAEKFVRGKKPAAIHMSVVGVERSIRRSYLQQFHDAREYFGLPTSFLYREFMNTSAVVGGVAVNRLDYDDPHAPPAYTPDAPNVSVTLSGPSGHYGQHCCTCTCGTHGSPPYEENFSSAPSSPMSSPNLSSSPGSSPSHSPSPSSSSISLFRPLRASLSSLSRRASRDGPVVVALGAVGP